MICNNGVQQHLDQQVGFIQRLIDQDVRISGDVVEICASIWAIHGVVPVDGNVIVAEFATRSEAQNALARVSPEPASGGSDRIVGYSR